MQRIREKTWRVRRAQAAAERLAPAVVRSLLAMDYEQRREALAEELGRERHGLREQWEQRRGELRRQSWRAWVRAQAEQGDEAAKRVLRGDFRKISYRTIRPDQDIPLRQLWIPF
jgi:hypothetical protein